MNIIKAGRFYGYPLCCIEQFWNNGRMRPWRERLNEPAFANHPFITSETSYGYIPCSECVKRPVDELVAEINANRQAPTPFPTTVCDDPADGRRTPAGLGAAWREATG
jgi:hypothetical protein